MNPKRKERTPQTTARAEGWEAMFLLESVRKKKRRLRPSEATRRTRQEIIKRDFANTCKKREEPGSTKTPRR